MSRKGRPRFGSRAPFRFRATSRRSEPERPARNTPRTRDRDRKRRMSTDDRTIMIHRRTPESAAMVANTKRAMAITPRLNRLTYADADEIRALFSELIGSQVDDIFMLIPPFYTAHR